MSREIANVFVVVQRKIADSVVHFRGAVDRRVFGVREVDQVDAVLLTVDGYHLSAFLAVVYDDLVIFAARYQRFAARRKVDAVNLVGVLAKHLGHLEATHHLVHQLHVAGRREQQTGNQPPADRRSQLGLSIQRYLALTRSNATMRSRWLPQNCFQLSLYVRYIFPKSIRITVIDHFLCILCICILFFSRFSLCPRKNGD